VLSVRYFFDPSSQYALSSFSQSAVFHPASYVSNQSVSRDNSCLGVTQTVEAYINQSQIDNEIKDSN